VTEWAKNIQNFQDGLDAVSGIATSGYVLAFNMSWLGPEQRYVTMPAKWQRIYDRGLYFSRDPVFYWMLRNEGAIRWSEIASPDPFGVKKEACLYGLNFGAIVSVKSNNRRSFLSVARDDREVEDDEIETLVNLMNDWTSVVSGGELSQGEIEVLQAFSEGCEIGEVAETLKLSQAGVKKRLKHATLKLGAKNRTHAIAVALKKGFIDP
jgi:LuxR family transcriptional regulator, quorum-sensing system regulator SdiA